MPLPDSTVRVRAAGFSESPNPISRDAFDATANGLFIVATGPMSGVAVDVFRDTYDTMRPQYGNDTPSAAADIAMSRVLSIFSAGSPEPAHSLSAICYNPSMRLATMYQLGQNSLITRVGSSGVLSQELPYTNLNWPRTRSQAISRSARFILLTGGFGIGRATNAARVQGGQDTVDRQITAITTSPAPGDVARQLVETVGRWQNGPNKGKPISGTTALVVDIRGSQSHPSGRTRSA